MKTRVAIPTHRFCLPLIRMLERIDSLVVVPGAIDAVARMLRQRDVDVAFVSPIEYARESSEYRIIPGFCASSHSGIKLCFREGLMTIQSLAADPSRTSEIVLAQMILREEFESRPPIVPMVNESIDAMLAKADAALWLPDGDEFTEGASPGLLDLIEAWGEMVRLPYVHGVLCVREDLPVSKGVRYLLGDRFANDVSEIRSSLAGSSELLTALDSYQFIFDATAREGLAEFLRYAHYHGMLRDIPSIRLYADPDATNEN